ncbi:MAG TPA: pectinesterase family protein [Chitinophagaceae bacterium]
MKSCVRRRYFLSGFFILGLTGNYNLNAQQPAFPGAEGAGKYTSGGRGTVTTPTTVYEVTNLTDNNTPGSLRYAVSQTVAYRTIVFRVSGTIHLNSKLTIRGNTTIAGQTAPGDGICIADHPTVISGDNVIIRYMRFRMGDKNQLLTSPAGCGLPVAPFTAACTPIDGSGGDDAFSNLGNKNIIIDHCSVSWSSDEALTMYRGDSLTLQWNIISEPLNYSYHFETGDVDFESHGYGGIWGSRNGSFHHNLIADAKGRCPRFAGSSAYPPGTAGQENADFRNNVIYNWGSYSTNGGEGGNYNIVNNYYKYGPSTGTGNSVSIPIRGMIVQPSAAAPLPYGKFYVQGNYVDGYSAITNNNWLGVSMSGTVQADTTLAKATSEFNIMPVPTHTAQQAYDFVLQYAGASFARDTLDQRIVNDVMNRAGRLIDVQGGYPHGTPYAQTVNAWPALNSTAAPVDTDHDGMPDTYETSNGLNPNDAADRGLIASNGYTNLENYINGLVTAPTITTTGSLSSFTQNIPAVSATQTYNVSGTGLTNDITITPPANFQVSGDGGVNWFGNATPLVIAQSSGMVAPKTISVRMNATIAGPYSGNIINASSGAAAINVAVSGNAFISTAPPGTSLVVAQDGSGDYTTVQAAINAAPAGLTAPFIIFIKNGKYYEKITIPSNKPFIHLVGESVANVILYYDDGASDPLPGGGTVGTQNSASFTVNATDFAALNITFANTYGDGTQGVAVLVNNDRAVFKNCRFLGNQDTLYIKGSGTPRHYFKNCYIDGNVDFIFGSSVAVFDSTVVYPKSRTTAGSSYITAANTPAGQTYGYVFRDCKIPNNTGATSYVLGRPWQNSTGSSPFANNKVVFLNTMMGSSISPAGWSIWDAGTNTSLIYYGEYQSKFFNGTPVNVSQRVPWSFQLNATEAASYTNANLFGAWDPCAVNSSVCINASRDIAISNFRGAKGATNSVFDWNISWAMDQIKYELYRSATRASGYTKIGEVTATNDTAVNFQMTDAFPVAGSSYFYYVAGSKTGFTSHITDTVEISSVPTIITTGTLQPFIQNVGTPSTSQNITVSGENLLGNVTLIPPVNFEISSNGGSTWTTNPATIDLAPTGNNLAATTIAVRLNAALAATYIDSIRLTTSGGITKYVKLQGTTAVIAPSTTVTLLHWPFTMNNADSALVRAAGVMPSTPSFYNLYSSNGTTVAAIPAYSPQYGQAFGTTANGDGSWGTAVGGPGGTLRRTFYEQFTVTADNGYELNVDSLYVTGAFYNTSSNTRLAVVYSMSNFVSDSADVFTIPGGFANPASLPNQTSGPTAQFPLSVAGLGGVTLQPGQTLTFRFYFSCGSSSAGRYAMLKDVKVVGTSTDLTTVREVIQQWPFTINGADSAAVRNIGVVASTPSFGNLYLSNGTTVAAIPAYSSQYGQAFGATANGDGSWGTAAGGPGGTLRRTFYEQFTVTAAGGYSLIVDSLNVNGAFYNTSSNTRLAVVYSLSNFVSDSADVFTIPGGFANPATLPNQNTGFGQYQLSIAGPGGITLQPGQTLTFRFYFSCGSSSNGRYGLLKDIKVIGTSIPVVGPPSLITVTGGALNSFFQTTGSPSSVQTYVVSGTDLTTNITITPPANYEVSADGGTSWFTNASPLVLAPTGGTVASTTISVRLNAAVPGVYNGDIINASTGATTVNVAVSGTTSAPSFMTVTGTLNAFSQVLGTPSSMQTYTISGTGLTQNITITPPLNYQVSGDGGTTWFTNALPLVLTQAGGVVAATTISVRLNAPALGAYSGNISNVSSGTATVNVAVSGNTVPVPSITVTGTLNAFFHTVGTPSAAQTYTVSGADLAGNITITPPVNFEVSGDGGTTWKTNTAPLVLTPAGGIVASTTVSVRMNATTAGASSGNIVHTSSGAPTVNLAVTGNALPTPLITVAPGTLSFTQILGTASAAQTFTASGASLTGNITVTAPAAYELSTNGGTSWSTTSITLTQTGGTVSSTTISVRLNAAAAGLYSGSITLASSGAVTKNIMLTGTTVLKPVIVVTQNLVAFSQTIGAAPHVQNYTVAGNSLTGNIIITPPPHFQISTNGSAWQSTAVTLNRVGTTVASTQLWLRLNVPVTGMFSGLLRHTSADADSVNITLNGNSKVAGEYAIYPVPATRVIFVAHPITTEKATLTFYNLSGQKITTYYSQPNTIETMIDITVLPQGLYYAEYRLGDTKVMLKFIKS